MQGVDEETPIPSEGAPRDLQRGGNIPNLWKHVAEIAQTQKEQGEKISKLCEDVAFIKGKLEGAQVVEDRTSNLKAGVIAAVVGGAIALIGIFI